MTAEDLFFRLFSGLPRQGPGDPASTLRALGMGRRALLTPYAVHALTVPFTVSHQKATQELGFNPGPVRQALRDALAWHHAHQVRAPGPGRVARA